MKRNLISMLDVKKDLDEIIDLGINLSDDIIHSIQHEEVAGEFQSSIKILLNISRLHGEKITVDNYIQQLID